MTSIPTMNPNAARPSCLARTFRRSITALLLGVAVLSAACRMMETEIVPPGGTFYTQFSLQYEQDRYRTTNYRRGLLLPVNTEVELLSMTKSRTKLHIVSSGRELLVENMPQHTGEDMEVAFGRLCAPQPLDLSAFSENERAAILLGRIEVGMSREAVLAALGPPPQIGTPSLDAREWKYWDSRWTTFLVTFDDDGRVLDTGHRLIP